MSAHLRRVAITATLAFIIATAVPSFVHRRDFDAAVFRWTENQSLKSATILATERASNRRLKLQVGVAVGFAIFVALNVGLLLKDRLRHAG